MLSIWVWWGYKCRSCGLGSAQPPSECLGTQCRNGNSPMLVVWILAWNPLESVEWLSELAAKHHIQYMMLLQLFIDRWSHERLIPLKTRPTWIFQHLSKLWPGQGELTLTLLLSFPLSQKKKGWAKPSLCQGKDVAGTMVSEWGELV